MNQHKLLFEVERKRILEIDQKDFLGILKSHNFYIQDEQREIDTYYSRPDIDYMKTVECLRVRERSNFAEVTYKPATTSKTRTNDGVTLKHETNLPISYNDISIAKQLLINVGMVQLAIVDKSRRTFKSASYPKLTISIDIIKGAGIFIETEVVASNRTRALSDMIAVEKLLKIDNFSIITKPYRDLCMESKE